jgi:acyl carrier protein
MATIEEKLRQLIVTHLNVRLEDISLTSSYVMDLGADDLDMEEFLREVEGAFDIEIPDDEKQRITTVYQTIDFVNANLRY